METREIYYGDYLQLDSILNAQHPESEEKGQLAHDEYLFIITHQAYELWFKQILVELDSIRIIMAKPSINDNSPEVQVIVHRLRRITEILKVLIQQIDVLETMTPLDFLDFRDLLRPASGFQSYQFKMIEAALGLKLEDRHASEFYLEHLHEDDIRKVKDVENQASVVELVNDWLERMPFFGGKFWNDSNKGDHPFWKEYRSIYADSLVEGETENLKEFDRLFGYGNGKDIRRFTNEANRSALFIMLYRDYPLLQPPYQLINSLIEIDEQLATWRYRHMNMVHRMIGNRIGTGGSSGKSYLRAAMEKHYIFMELADLTSYLIDRGHLPQLPDLLQKDLGFTLGRQGK